MNLGKVINVIIENNIFSNFLQKITLGGSVTELVLFFDEEGMKCLLKNEESTIVVDGVLKKEAFDNYDDFEGVVLGIRDVSKLMKMIKPYPTLKIKVEDSKVVFSHQRKRTKIPLLEPSFVKTYIAQLPFEIDLSGAALADTSDFKDFTKVAKTIGEKFKVSCKNKMLTISCQGNTGEEISDNFPMELEDFTSWFWNPLIEVVQNLGEQAEFLFESDKPCLVREETKTYKIIYLVAEAFVDESERL